MLLHKRRSQKTTSQRLIRLMPVNKPSVTPENKEEKTRIFMYSSCYCFVFPDNLPKLERWSENDTLFVFLILEMIWLANWNLTIAMPFKFSLQIDSSPMSFPYTTCSNLLINMGGYAFGSAPNEEDKAWANWSSLLFLLHNTLISKAVDETE